ncbi:hypothetical protein JXB27_01610 [Candidatus Woesearchaeota archaeon]|nr:hypothetical protein [Candidatus Woesearchaeota archaeon]
MLSKSEWNRKIAINRWSKVLRNETNKIEKNSSKYPGLKARILAYLMGDGFVSARTWKTHKHHDVSFFPDNKRMLNSFLFAFEKIYEIKPQIKKEKNYFRVRASSKPIVLDLLKHGSFHSLEWRVPLNYLKSVSERKEWLRAFYDCEAYVGQKTITIQSVNKFGLIQICSMLKEFDIQSKIYEYKRKKATWNTNFLLHITRKEDRRRFLKEIGFTHTRKQRKLEKYASVAKSG